MFSTNVCIIIIFSFPTENVIMKGKKKKITYWKEKQFISPVCVTSSCNLFSFYLHKKNIFSKQLNKTKLIYNLFLLKFQ